MFLLFYLMNSADTCALKEAFPCDFTYIFFDSWIMSIQLSMKILKYL